MALIKCKDCGEQISKNAKSCPKCGASTPKRTSRTTWLIVILLGLGFYGYKSIDMPTASSPSSSKKHQIEVETPKIPTWRHSTSIDKMTGKLSAYASSPAIAASTNMSFPYNNVEATLSIGCDSESEWTYISFNSAPNLANTKTKDGYNLIATRIKWNNTIQEITLSQDWGAEFLHFRDAETVINNIASSNSALLELQWHGQQPTYFDFTLNGSTSALKAIRAECSK